MASFTVTVSGWTSLGSAPALIECFSTCGVWIIDAATRPDASVLSGAINLEGLESKMITPTETLWALPGQGAPTAKVGVTPQAAQPVKVLLAMGASKALPTTNTSVSTALTPGIKAVTIFARNSDAYIKLGDGEQTASASTAIIDMKERLDFDVSGYATPHIAVIYGPSAAEAVIHVTELV